MDKPMTAMNKPMIAVAALVVVAAAGAWYYLQQRPAPQTPAAAPEAPIAASAPPETAIEHPAPVSQGASLAPLPSLNDSDSPLRDALADVAGPAAVAQYLVPENLIRRIVVTVDNLPRQKVPAAKRPVIGIPGSFLAQGDEEHPTVDPRNFERYKAAVGVLGKLDAQRLAAAYLRFYPLFQQAYEDLGYPKGYFNDRLVQAIDSLLATPEHAGAIELARPNVMYTFADPALEARPAGQKLLLRMGPENAAIVKAKLRELRTAVTAQAPRR